jgi:hypothetical protein
MCLSVDPAFPVAVLSWVVGELVELRKEFTSVFCFGLILEKGP